MALLIEDKDLQAAQMTEEELRLEIAILLYQQAKFSTGKASAFANMSRVLFQKELGKRKIPVNYDLEELNKDLVMLNLDPVPNDRN